MERRRGRESRQREKFSVGIAVIYAAIGGTWIFFSDRFTASLFNEPSAITLAATVKGFCYVLLTASLLYVLVNRGMKKIETSREALRSTEERYRELVQNANSIILRIDAEGKITFFNEYAESFFGYAAEEILGRNVVGTIVPEEGCLGCDLPEFLQKIAEIPEQCGQNENENMRRNGERVWVAWANRAILREDGSLQEVLCVGHDITERKRMDMALRESEVRYRKLFEEAGEGIVLTDAKSGEILDCNLAFEQLSQYKRSELTGKPHSILFPSSEGKPAESVLSSSSFGCNMAAIDLVTKSGTVKKVDIKSSILEIDGRSIVQDFFDDVTAEARYRDEREATLRMLRLMNDHANILELVRNITVFLQKWTGCDAVGIRLSEGNDFPYVETRGFPAEFVEMEKYLCPRGDEGRSKCDGEGQPVLECMCGNVLFGRVDPSLPFFTEKGSFWTNSTSELLASTSEEQRQSVTRNRCNGMGYESVALVPLRHAGITHGLLQINDHTPGRFGPEMISFLENTADQIAIALSQYKAEAALRTSEQRFRDVSAAAGEFIWEVDRHGFFTYLSERVSEVLGFAAEELTGKWVFDLMEETERGRHSEFLREQSRSKKGFRNFEYRLISKQGRSVWLSSTAVPMIDEKGELLGFRGATLDISERKQAEEERTLVEAQLRQAQKMEALGTLAGGIAHDFNNILGIIIGYTEMAEWDLGGESPVRRNLQEVLGAAHRAKELVQQILAFSRRSEQEKVPVQVGLIVNEALKMLRASLPSTISVVTRIASESIVLADPTQVHQVLMNLCTNAAHAMAENGGVLGVNLSDVYFGSESLQSHTGLAPGAYVRLTVSDTGHGMDSAVLERIFEPFFTTKEQGAGTGLGLAVVHGIVKSHEGRIEVASVPGEGTAFHVYLPVVESASMVPKNDEVPLPCGRERILIVDDEPALAVATQFMLERLGYRVDYRTNGMDALDAFRPGSEIEPFDLVITDMTMPDLTGADLARELNRLKPGLPIILCTGFSEKMDEEKAKRLGIRGLLMKPYILRELAELTRKVLDSAGL